MIIIAGGGPVGLYLAILLSKKFPNQVCIIDDRLGEFTRPGVIAPKIKDVIEKFLGELAQIKIDIPISNSTPSTIEISKLQKVLYKAAKKSGVQFVKSNFAGIENNQIKLATDSSFRRSVIY